MVAKWMEAWCSSSFFVSFSVDVSLLDSTLLLDSTTDTSPQRRRSQNVLVILSPLQATSSLVRIYYACHGEEFPVLVNPASTTNFFNLIQRLKANLWKKAGHLVRGVVQCALFPGSPLNACTIKKPKYTELRNWLVN